MKTLALTLALMIAGSSVANAASRHDFRRCGVQGFASNSAFNLPCWALEAFSVHTGGAGGGGACH